MNLKSRSGGRAGCTARERRDQVSAAHQIALRPAFGLSLGPLVLRLWSLLRGLRSVVSGPWSLVPAFPHA